MDKYTTPPIDCQSPTNAFRWLSSRRQWVAWRYMERESGKLTKPPVCPRSGADADVTDPATWGTWEDARARQLEDGLPGMGFVLTAGDGLVGVDLDGCLDHAGNLAPWAAAIVDLVDSYTETSPSGTGLHILAFGSLPAGKRREGPIEAYETSRYLTYTGAVLGGRWALCERTEALATMHARYLGAQPAPATSKPAASSASPTLDDLAILDKLFRSRSAPRVARLWTGDTSDYPTPSEGDMALASYLAFYTQDPAQIRRLVGMSALGSRPQWRRETASRITIQKAIDSRLGTYDPAWRGAR